MNIGSNVKTTQIPIRHGKVIKVHDMHYLDKTYKIYNVRFADGTEWINELYLEEA